MHKRYQPVGNHFTYPVYSLLINLDQLPDLNQRLWLFGYNKQNIVSIWDKDHLGDPAQSIKSNLLAYLARQGVDAPTGPIYMLTNARILGYVFNPVTFYYCYDSNEQLSFIVAEVNNTDGEQYPYLLNGHNTLPAQAKDERRDLRRYWADKRFYVSPLMPMEARYEFAFTPVAQHMIAHIDEFHQGEKLFKARLWGDLRPLTNRSLNNILWRYPLMTLQIIFYIHWQAVKVYRQGVPILPKPTSPPSY